MAYLSLFIYTLPMSELYEFVKKVTKTIPDISYRKLYGLNSFYMSDRPFIVITTNDEIVVRVDDFQMQKTIENIPQIERWILNDKVMDNWYILPEKYNKKKNKLSPILEMTSKVLLRPKKEKKKRIKKVKVIADKKEQVKSNSLINKILSVFTLVPRK